MRVGGGKKEAERHSDTSDAKGSIRASCLEAQRFTHCATSQAAKRKSLRTWPWPGSHSESLSEVSSPPPPLTSPVFPKLLTHQSPVLRGENITQQTRN